jgi:hypothetical protein
MSHRCGEGSQLRLALAVRLPRGELARRSLSYYPMTRWSPFASSTPCQYAPEQETQASYVRSANRVRQSSPEQAKHRPGQIGSSPSL